MNSKYSRLFITLILFISFNVVVLNQLNAQKTMQDYTLEWNKIEAFTKKGLPQSALAEVNKIYAAAKKSNNEAQLIKALLFKTNLQEGVTEEATVQSIQLMETESNLRKGAAKALLQSITAQLYWNYFQQNRYKLYARTNTENFDKKDIATWTRDDLHHKIAELYSASLKEEKLLKKTKLNIYEPLILKGNTRPLRPTLFDLLAHRALDYFKNDERDITRPAYAFEIKETELFDPAKDFSGYSFHTKDTTSLHYEALVIFQKLLALHMKDENPGALIDVDLERLAFVYQYGVIEDKTELYIKALKLIGEKYANNAASAQAQFLIARVIHDKALEADNQKKVSVYSVRQAKEILEVIVRKYPESQGGVNAQNLLITIKRPEINLTTEKVNVPGIPFRSLVTYKNTSRLFLRLIHLTPELKNWLRKNNDNEKIFSRLIAEDNFRHWQQPLPATEDYLNHSVEIKIEALPVGEYVLLGSTEEKFLLNNTPLNAQYFYVSNISYISSSQQYFALNRTTGQPLSGAKVQVWNTEYDYKIRDYQLSKKENLVADQNGFFQLKQEDKKDKSNPGNARNVRLEISYKNDFLFLDDYQYVYLNSYDREAEEYKNQKEFDEDNARVYLFTDRSIYRPGQLVYFKGIGVTRDFISNKTTLLTEKDSLQVNLIDANGQKADSMKVRLNEFGSFNGKFKLPENNLNGEFEIELEDYDQANVSFSVEEYKRPKFYTEIEKTKDEYRINDTVTITGFAKAYAGNNIEGAKVSYRVTREARFIYPWLFRGKGFPNVQAMEIAHGELVTEADGKFNLQFKAMPDLALDKNTDPVFDYKIVVDVTDLNGETRSTEATLSVGYKALNLQINLSKGQVISLDSLRSLSVTSRNLNGEIVPVEAKLRIYPLVAPGRLIRKRLWEAPDTFILNEEAFISYFPHDEYKEETKEETWERGNLLVEKMDTISSNTSISFSAKGFTQGWYVVEVTAKDKYGQEIKNIQYFQAFDEKSNQVPASQYIWNWSKNKLAQPGQTTRIITGSAADSVFLIQELNTRKTFDFTLKNPNDEVAAFTFYNLNQNKKVLDLKITEADRGGFGIHSFFVKDNRFFSLSNTVEVPWTNKELNLSFTTYRDKTLPGSEEKWTMKVTGQKGEKLAAEMLASMYDASLDQFKSHSWSPMVLWPMYNGYNDWQGSQNFTTVNSFEKYRSDKYLQVKERRYDALNYLPNAYRLYASGGILRRNAAQRSDMLIQSDAIMSNEMVAETGMEENETVKKSLAGVVAGVEIKSKEGAEKPSNEPIDQSTIKIRKNFNETAFFLPDLKTDKDGNIEFSFTMPEALTQWKIMTLAHTKELATGYAEKTIITQKELMVQPNAPRFFREGDKMEFSAKIVNLGDKALTGLTQFQLLNASTMNPVDGWFKNTETAKAFTVAAGQSTLVTFQIEIPANFNEAVVYRIVAKAGSISDGEEAAIPVITNRMLVTESLPLPLRGEGSKAFTFEKLLKSGSSPTLTNYGLTLEYTTNPAWYAVQALPYLIEYPYECSEQNFNRFYANALALKIANSSPKIKAIFEKWRAADTTALLSNLQKNEELKSVLLQETPWVLQAQTEAQQKKNIALLFDMVKMSGQLAASLDKVGNMQSPNGGFVWFEGGPDNRYITQYILTGLGHLKQLDAYPKELQSKLKLMLDKAIPYLDKILKEDYDNLVKRKANLKSNQLSTIAIQYLYMRSFFPEYEIPAGTQTAYKYYRGQAQEFWLLQSKYMQGMIALALHRTGDPKTSKSIIQSLKENAINNEELGMYWKEWDRPGYWWYQAPIEAQALMIEAFSEIDKDPKTIGDLKMWLLKNKQTTNWKTTKATAEAVYALLLQGTDWLSEERMVVINLGKTTFNSKDEKQEAGTGYFKRKIAGNQVKPEMGNIKVTLQTQNGEASDKESGGAWGSVYWQYFEDLDKITFAETPLKLSKKLFIEKNTDRGPVLTPINEGDNLHIGDKIKVRIELRVDRDMEFVHMKDMRASAMEPTNVLSQFKWQGGLGYYETTKDVSTNFFFPYLNKGTYVFEYPMFVTHAGNFSNGITTIQSMYAPEFTAHSEGVRVNIVK